MGKLIARPGYAIIRNAGPVLSNGATGIGFAQVEVNIFHSAEDAAAFVKATTIVGPSFELLIADGVTFQGGPCAIGAGMAVVLDAILAKGYEPDGFESCDGYRKYRYKLSA